MSTHTVDPRIGDTGPRQPILDRFRLDGRLVIVTGASSGLGAGFARALAEAGADLALAARRIEKLKELAAELRSQGHTVSIHSCDVSDPDQCAELVRAVMERHSRIDVLVNNAGTGSAIPALKESPEQFRSVMAVNLDGAFWMAKECAAVMAPGSAILNVASVLGITAGFAPQAAYTASKTGLIGLTRDLAAQWGSRRGIRVNALAPGYVASDMTEEIPEDLLRDILCHTLFGRLGLQYELDSAVVFLVSDAASFITGASLCVDGGMTMH